jgi:pimeloyl-ACP methyl ester carboxylesterase
MSKVGTTEYLPVAYLPGASGRSTVWEPIANVLAHRREALLFNYPGLGDAPPRDDVQSLSDLLRWIASELPERCDVVSLSTGSVLALNLALEYPERVRRLVLVTPCGGLDGAQFGALDWRPAFIANRPEAPRWFVHEHLDATARLGSIPMPTLVVCGAQDMIAPPSLGQFVCERLPSAKLEVLPDADHDLEEEYPALLASLIEAHLRR